MAIDRIGERQIFSAYQDTGTEINPAKRLARGLKGVVRKTSFNTSLLASVLKGGDALAEINEQYGPLELIRLEGFMRKEQADFFGNLLKLEPGIKTVAETGFNAGHSSFLFLDSSPDISVVSFDLGEHDYVDRAERYISGRFPGRHALHRGDSKVTVPEFAATHPDVRADLVFIDGGHDYETAAADLSNMRKMAASGALVVMDDYMPHIFYGLGPAQAWDEAVRHGHIAQEAILSGDGRTWAVGRYLNHAAQAA